jgi:hypothetical protein
MKLDSSRDIDRSAGISCAATNVLRGSVHKPESTHNERQYQRQPRKPFRYSSRI